MDVTTQKPRLKPITKYKIGVVNGTAYTIAQVYTATAPVPMLFVDFWNGAGWTRTTQPIKGKLGDLYGWSYRYKVTSTINKIIGKKYSKGYNNRYFDSGLEEVLGGTKQLLGA